MALQAETLVEEWFNRNGYFTIRGLKDKIEEIDILAVKNIGGNNWDCIHCEVQVSIRPVGYISKLTAQVMSELQVLKNTSAKIRNEQQLKLCAAQWVENKFFSPKKQLLRDKLMSSGNWRYQFIYGNVKDPIELTYIARQGVQIISFRNVLDELCTKRTEFDFSGSSAGDLVEIINFINE
ncbi:hypothetical protein [Alkalicoccobacillus porphyridii]|uniref:Uncharacterized protein n=1 Tax=Alkalicoccobacillus porphyridii TaxID=2597270 RepID=A0A553ZVW9_9BACI|nr:hypothetical protein [Alkalicoccobacillus porphyridii]TSB45573.1 hypothetical protein FN960_15500 [Alkalicoccobacillus porphyridii]